MKKLQASAKLVLAMMLVLFGSEARAELELIDSQVVMSTTGVWVDDDEAQFSRRHGI